MNMVWCSYPSAADGVEWKWYGNLGEVVLQARSKKGVTVSSRRWILPRRSKPHYPNLTQDVYELV